MVRAIEARTPKNVSDFVETLLALVLLLARGKDLQAVGIGAAGIVEGTTLECSPNIPFIRNFDFRRLWPRSVRLRVDNDARCFARAELLRGAGRDVKSLFALTIGTGVGRAYGRDGRIVKLKKFEYPEPWEKGYQRLRERRNDARLADFLGEELAALLRPFAPDVVVAGGGVMTRPGFSRQFRTSLKTRGLRAKILRPRLGENAVAVGAALLFNE